jgi:hypothetical protein
MSRRRTAADVGSLELLLDTICNVFGTIILLTLLVALMLTRSSNSAARERASAASQSELINAEIERDELTRRLARMGEGAKSGANLSGVVASAELLTHARRLRSAQAEHAELVESKSDVTGAASDAQVAINEINEDAAEREEQIQRAEQDAEKLKEQLAAAVKEHSRAATIPKMAQTTLTIEAMYFLKAGRLYGPLEFADGTPNERDFTQTPQGGNLIIQEKASGGIDVDASAKSLGPLRAKFGVVEPSSTYVRLWIWWDSYEHFNAVRLVLEDRGIKYELKPTGEGTTVYRTVGPRDPAVVQ